MFAEPDLRKWARLNTLPHAHTFLSRTVFISKPRQWCGLRCSPSCISTTERSVKQTQQAGTGSIGGEMALLRPPSHCASYICTTCPPTAYINGNSSLQILLWKRQLKMFLACPDPWPIPGLPYWSKVLFPCSVEESSEIDHRKGLN